MRFASFRVANQDSFGIVSDNGITDIGKRNAIASLKTLLREHELNPSRFSSTSRDYDISDVQFLPVIPDPEQVFCVGANYRDHVAQSGIPGVREFAKPALFIRVAQSLCGHLQPIIRPKVSEQLDFECELAVIIGKPARHVSKEDAFEYVAGYSCFNDGSIRDWQAHTSQATPGKNFAGTGGFGPWLVTRDEFADPPELDITTRLNGQVMQKANTKDMIFDIPTIISYLSAVVELRPGDVIATGTCLGVGAGRKPPIWMKPGDICEVEIERIGTLINPIASE